MRRVRAFTLIELLVVVAVLAVLLAMLMPAMSGARRAARTVQCAADLGRIGDLWHAFAMDHSGHGPGRAANAGIPPSPYAWSDMLNYEMLGQKMGAENAYFRPIQHFNSPDGGPIRLAPDSMGCPEIARLDGLTGRWARPYIANAYMVGGPNWVPGRGDPRWPRSGGIGLYGKSAPNPGYLGAWYTLGTKVQLAGKPRYNYLVFEAARGHDSEIYRSSHAPGSVTEENPIAPQSGTYAFRHPGLTANFLCVDGHVERQHHDEAHVNTPDRFHW